MANVTISIEDDLLKKGRKYAQKHNTSLNAMIRRLLRKTVESESNHWLDECFSLMDQANVNSGGKKWDRGALYDR
jgi:plasmid stability protein